MLQLTKSADRNSSGGLFRMSVEVSATFHRVAAIHPPDRRGNRASTTASQVFDTMTECENPVTHKVHGLTSRNHDHFLHPAKPAPIHAGKD